MLARHLRDAWPSDAGSASSGLTAEQQQRVAGALRAYEGERRKRVLPVSLRSHAIGAAGQVAFPLVRCSSGRAVLCSCRLADCGLVQVCRARDAVISRLLPIGHFLDHTLYDCGSLA